jgi:hypothetical protein
VKGNSTIEGDSTVNGNLNVAGDSTLNTLSVNDIVLENKGSIIAEGYVPNNNLTLPMPDGPYAVDHFQIGRDNVQIRTPVKYRVDQVPNLQVSNVSTITVDGVEYFGRLVNGKPVYLSYPLTLTLDMYVPSIRQNKEDTNNFFPNEDESYAGHFPLNNSVLADSANFNEQGTLSQVSSLVPQMAYVPDNNSLGNLLINKPLSDWDGLKTKFLLDNPNVSAYNRLVAVVNSLIANLNGTTNRNAYLFLCKIIGSYGVPVQNENINSVDLNDRLQAYNLILASSNYQRYKKFQTYAPRHGLKQTKDAAGLYQPNYDFNNINVSVGKPNISIFGDPNTVLNLEIMTTKLASWGIACVAFNMTYVDFPMRVPGKNLSAIDIITKGNSFPEIVSVFQDFNMITETSNYSSQSTDAKSIYGGYIYTMGWNYDDKNSTTGTSALEFNQDTIQAILDMLRNARDINGQLLSNKLNTTNRFGCFGRSGGSNVMCGAHMINRNVRANTFSCGVGQDIVLTLPYWGFDGTKADWRGGSGYANDVMYTFPGGLNYPIMFIEPEVDWYQEQNVQLTKMLRWVVGARKSLQNLIRKTSLPVRARSIYMEGPITGHADTGPFLWSQDVGYKSISGSGITQPNKPRFPDIYKDSVYGFSDLSNNRANLSQALLNAMCLYFRVFQSNFESISAAMFNYVPFKFDQSPWDIPGADDYQWNYRFYREDVGGVFNQRLDSVVKQTFIYEGVFDDNTFEQEYTLTIDDPTIDLISINQQFTSLNGEEIGDADFYLYNQKGVRVSGSESFANPEYLFFDLSPIQPEDRLGDWKIYTAQFQGNCKYVITADLCNWKLVFDSQYNYNKVNINPELSLNNKAVNIANIPTSPVGLIKGDIWADNGSLKIVL